MTKKWLVSVALGLALVAGPYLACSASSETEVGYSEAELKGAVLGAWEGNADIDGESVDFSLVLEHASVKSKPGNTTTVVSGTITSVNPALNGSVDGEISVGKELARMELGLRLEDGTQLGGSIESQALSDGRILRPQRNGTFSLSRP